MLPLLLCIALATLTAGAAGYERADVKPPPVAREFRGVWIATVKNTDWPSKPGLSTAEQKAELITILNRAAELRLNAVVFQIRPEGDAFYESRLEPWSEFLTGTMGRAPEPLYDPLAFAVEEAHRRGLELHAWFNPFRARGAQTGSPAAPNHETRTMPAMVRRYGNSLWLDPGEPAVRNYVDRVIVDVVNRYDIDGVQIDDYFYPYPEKDSAGHELDFPDEASWRHHTGPPTLHRDDWRRENINEFVQRTYRAIKAAKPWVKFGVSPIGIWRPGYPREIKGSDAYGKIYADSRTWLARGWLDYFSPQLYWQLDPPEHSARGLLPWWSAQNGLGRQLWPGLAVYQVDQWKADEIPRQIEFVRSQPGVTGYVLYNAGSLFRHPALEQRFERELNAQPALVPASPWLNPSHAAPTQPYVFVTGAGEHLRASWVSTGNDPVRWWVVQQRKNGVWKTEILSGAQSSLTLANAPDAMAVTAVDCTGAASAVRTVAK